MTESNPIGRPPKYKTPQEMQRIIDLYFLACKVHQTGDTDLLNDCSDEDLLVINDIDDVKPTVTGLAYALDLTRRGLIDYEEKDDFYHTVKKGKQRIEKYLEQNLYGQSVVGTIFNLKNNYAWKDKTETELSGELKIDQLSDVELDAKLSLYLGEDKPTEE